MDLYFVNAFSQKPINHYKNIDENKIKSMIFQLERTISDQSIVELINFNKEIIKVRYINYNIIGNPKIYRLFFKYISEWILRSSENVCLNGFET